MMFGARWAIAAASSGVSAQTSVASPTSSARLMVRLISLKVEAPLGVVEQDTHGPGVLERLGQHRSDPAPDRDAVHVLGEDVEEGGLARDLRDVDVLGGENDPHVVPLPDPVRRLRQLHHAPAVQVRLGTELEERRLDVEILVHAVYTCTASTLCFRFDSSAAVCRAWEMRVSPGVTQPNTGGVPLSSSSRNAAHI